MDGRAISQGGSYEYRVDNEPVLSHACSTDIPLHELCRDSWCECTCHDQIPLFEVDE